MTANGQSVRACAPAGPGRDGRDGDGPEGAGPGVEVSCEAAPVPPVCYRFLGGGLLDARRAGWFSGLTLSREGGNTTVLQGHVPDQAGLHGLLSQVRDLGLTLISVEIVEQPHTRHGQRP